MGHGKINMPNLRPLWDALIDIYKVFDAICAKHKLVHYVGYGTLLGAIRHKGFIPWDDDFDVLMPRDDYEAFISLRSELPDYLNLMSLETAAEYKLLFAKIINTRGDVLDDIKSKTGLQLLQGIFIDIFPMDGIPNNLLSFQLWRIKRSFMRRRMSAFQMQNWFASRQYCTSRFVGLANHESSDRKKFVYDRNFLGTPMRVPFENISVSVPQCPDAVLTVDYGDWRTPPPVSQQKPTHQFA